MIFVLSFLIQNSVMQFSFIIDLTENLVVNSAERISVYLVVNFVESLAASLSDGLIAD